MSATQSSTLNLRLADSDPWFVEQQIFDYLSSYLQTTSTHSSEDAAKFFDGLLPSHRGNNPDGSDKETTGDFLWNAWESVHKIAQQVPHDNAEAQDRLAAFLVELKKIKSSPPTVQLRNWGETPFALWGDLPLFGPTVRELIDRVSPSAPEYRNFNAYLARVFRDGAADMSLFAIRAIDGAVGHVRKEGEVDKNMLAVAQIWIQVAGKAMWKSAKSNAEKGGKVGDDAAAWTSDDGLFEKRWQFWLEKFREIESSQGSLDKATRESAKRSRTLMEYIQAK